MGVIKMTGKAGVGNDQENQTRAVRNRGENSQQPVLLEFYASWCPRCAMMEDVVEEFASENRGGIKVCQIDEADAVLLMEQYGIDRVPSFLAFIKGKVTGAVTGVVSREVLERLF